MAISQISRMQIRRGTKSQLPSGTPDNPISLMEGELALTVDDGCVYIGTPNLQNVQNRKPAVIPEGLTENEFGQVEGGKFPYANTQFLTEHSRNAEELIHYVYRYRDSDNNEAFPGPGDGLDWTYDQAVPWDENSEVISRNLQERLDEIVSVKSYGAKGDGITDDTYAFWRAACDVVRIDAAQYDDPTKLKTTARRILYIPAGTYNITRPAILPPYSTWIGDGIDKTIIRLSYASTDFKSRCVVETVDDGYCSKDGLEILNERWTSETPSEQVLERTEYQIGNAIIGSSGITGTTLPDYLMCANLTFEHAGNIAGTKPARDVLRLNRSSKTSWYNVHFKGSNFLKTSYYGYIPRNIISEVIVTNGGYGYTYDTTQVNIVGNGYGAIAQPIIEDGVIKAIDVTNSGIGYTTASVEILTINGGIGYGARASVTTSTIHYEYTANEKNGKAMYNSGTDNPSLTDSISVFIDGLGGTSNGAIISPHDHVFINCKFSGTTYGFSMTDQVQNVVIDNCVFEEMFRGISIGENLWWYNSSYDGNLPQSGTIDSLPDELRNNIEYISRILLTNQDDVTKNNKIYSIKINGLDYSLEEIKSWGLHTNANLGDALPKGSFGGPSNIKITNCNFRKIVESGIFVEHGRHIISNNNSFERTVGRGYADDWRAESTKLPIIYFGSNSTNCSSINDWFSREDSEITTEVNTKRIIYNPLGDNIILDAQEPVQLPKFVSGNVSIPLTKTTILTGRPDKNTDDYYPPELPVIDPFPSQNQLISEFKNSGIELPISDLIRNGSDIIEVKDNEAFIIDYVITGNESRRMGQLYVISQFKLYPETSIVSLTDKKIVDLNDPMVRFTAVIKKYTGGKTYVNILYNNAYGTEEEYTFTFSVRKWKI